MTEVTTRPPTLGHGCNCPLASCSVSMWRLWGRGMGRETQGLCLWQPPHVCMCGSAKCSGVEPWLWGDDCYSTGVGFKNAFLMGMHFTGKSSVVCEANIAAEGYRSSACVRVFTRRRFISGNRLPSTGKLKNNKMSLQTILICLYKPAEWWTFAISGNPKPITYKTIHNTLCIIHTFVRWDIQIHFWPYQAQCDFSLLFFVFSTY